MSLTDLPLELWQNVALQVLFAVLSEVPSKGPVLPASLLAPPLDTNNYGNAGSVGRDPVLPWQLLRRDDAPVSDCTCRTPLGMFSGQTQFCYSSHPPSSKSPILALLAINRNLRSGLIGLREFWSQIPLMFPHFLPDSLIWAGCHANFPLRLVSDGLCRCVLTMLLREPRFLEFASDLSIALPYHPSWDAEHPSELLFRAIQSRSQALRLLDLRFDATRPFYTKKFEFRELPPLRICRGLNNPILVYSPALTELYLAAERPELAVPVNVIADMLRKCPLLEVLTLQMVLHPPQDSTLRPIFLGKLRFMLVCDSLLNWHFLRDRLIVPSEVSAHVDTVIDAVVQDVRTLDVCIRYTTMDVFRHFNTGCKAVLMDYHEVQPVKHGDARDWPEYVRFTFAETEAAAWAERDPEQTALRCSFTIRFHGVALQTRYPPHYYPLGRPLGTAPAAEVMFRQILGGLAGTLPWSTTKVFIEKAGGRARHMVYNRDILQAFRNLRTLVIYGVTSPQSYAVTDLVSELAYAGRPHWGLERVRLPDWECSEETWDIWNALIEDRNPGGPRVEWSR